MRSLRTALIVIAAGLSAGPVAGQQLPDNLQVHGFAGWGYGKTDGNSFQLGTEDGSYDNVNFSLNLNASLGDRLMIAAQAEWMMEGDETVTDLDYVFAQWRFANSLFLRIGQVQQPFGIYTEVYDVGTLRPFLELPQGVYGVSGFIAESYLGAGITGDFFTRSNWTIAYDLYVGELKTPMGHWVMGYDFVTGEPVAGNQDTFDLSNMIGGRLVVTTPVTGLGFGASFYNGEPEGFGGLTDGFVMEGRRTVVGFQLEYNTDSLWARGEYVTVAKGSVALDGAEITSDAAYAEIAYKLSPHWQLAGRYDWQDNVFGPGFDYGPQFSSLNEHRDLGFAVNYWFSPNLVIKTEYHKVDGNRFAAPDWDNFWEIFYGIEETTDVFQIGAQFSF